MSDASDPIQSPQNLRLRHLIEAARLFLRLGATAFGGPAASIAMMRDETVTRRRWLSEQRFLDLLGAANLSPGPTASKVAMYLGQSRAGLAGLLIAGVGFLLPAMLITLVLAWAYVEYGTTPAAEWLLYGIKPVIIPLILAALWSLGRRAVKDTPTAMIGIGVLLLYFIDLNLVLLLVGGGIVVLVVRQGVRFVRFPINGALVPLMAGGHWRIPPVVAPLVASTTASISLSRLFLVFLKIGAVMYGSGYVLLAFLQADLVEGYGWLTEQQLIDAIAIGQMTPGPLSTSATVIGYVLAGVPGALLATLGIYLPAFVIVAVSNPIIPRLRDSAWASSFLDGVNVAALGLMAAVTWNLARAAYPDLFTAIVGLLAIGLLLRYNIGSGWLVAFGAGMGLLSAVI